MRIAVINTYSTGSTGTVANMIGHYAEKKGNIVKYFYGRNKNVNSDWIFIGENSFSLFWSNLMTYITGNVGAYHVCSTKKLISELIKFNPEVIHLHNLHGNYLNFQILFSYLESFNGKVVLTLHDEFFLTGRCALLFCDKWIEGCHNCKHLGAYPRVLIDKSYKLQKEKIEFLEKIKNLEIITPSDWLKKLVDSSKISHIKHKRIYNGLSNEKPEPFDIQKIIDKRKINILFSAYTWSEDKGALIVKELASKIDRTKYNLIINGYGDYCADWFDFECKKVGLLKREQMLFLLKNVDIFINPTFKDNLPTILIESLQVGTPVITFNTGGCKEIVDDSCGVVVDEKTSSSILNALEHFDFSVDWNTQCIRKAKKFSLENTICQYIKAYK